MIHSRGAKGSTAEIIWTQILQGLGGGFAAVANQVCGQASVPHVDVAIVTAVLLLLTEIGGGVGNAVGEFFVLIREGNLSEGTTLVAGAMWTALMPGNLEKALPNLSSDERKKLFGSISDVLDYPREHPIRMGVIEGLSCYFLFNTGLFSPVYSVRQHNEKHGYRCHHFFHCAYNTFFWDARLVSRRYPECGRRRAH